VAVELIFWGGVLVVLGHLIFYPPPELQPDGVMTVRVAPHGRLGRVLLVVGGAFLYGSLTGRRLRLQALILLVLSALQALFMGAVRALYIFESARVTLFTPGMVARAWSLELGLDFAILVALLMLLREARLVSRGLFWVGPLFWLTLALAALFAPILLPEAFWQKIFVWSESESASGVLSVVGPALAVLAFILLVKMRRLLHGQRPLPAMLADRSSDGGGG
jgi:hypothetical protein